MLKTAYSSERRFAGLVDFDSKSAHSLLTVMKHTLLCDDAKHKTSYIHSGGYRACMGSEMAVRFTLDPQTVLFLLAGSNTDRHAAGVRDVLFCQ